MDRPLVVLLVEDSPTDRRLTQDTLQETGITLQLFPVATAEEALGFLRRDAGYEGCPRPDLVLLDLGLPGMSGTELLTTLRDDPALRTVPVLVQTGDDDDRTLVETIGLGAHEFVAKPLDAASFLAVVEYVTEFA